MAGAANAGEVRARLVLDNAQFRQGVQQARGDMQGLSGSAASSAKGMSMLTTASAAVGTAVVAAVGASVGAAANFEQSMARVKAISNATDSEFAALSKTAKDLGASTQFSASQAAEGLSFLSMAGFKAEQSIKALPSVLNLAAAGQMELGRSADIVSNIMTGFGVSADDTGHAVDVLVKTMTSANTDLPMLGDAMKYVAPVAASLGISMEDTATAVAKMSDAGIQGSMAGTALRAALLQLNSPVGAAAKEMEKLGLNVKDAEGNMLPLPQIIGKVNEKTKDMTDSQKTATAAHLVGTEAASGFVALLKVGEQGLADYSKGLENSAGTAERVAKIQQDTLKGAWDELTSGLEGLAIGIGETLLPAFTSLVQGATSFVDVLAKLDPQMVSAGLAAAGTAAGVALFAVGVTKAITAVRALSVALISNPATAWIAGISIAVGALTGVLMSGKKEVEEYKEISFDTYKSLDEQSKTVTKLADDYDAMRGKVKLNNEELLKYQSLQTELERATDPRTKAEIQAALDALVEKSGANNEEIKKTIDLSDKLIEQSPATARSFNDKGQAIATSTDATRQYVDELNKAKEAELELQKANAMKNLHKDLTTYKESIKTVNDLIDDTPNKVKKVEEAQSNLATREEVLAKVRQNGSERQIALQQQIVDKAKDQLSTSKQELQEHKAKIYSKQAEVSLAEQALQKGNATFDQIASIKMAQAGVNYEKGKEIEAIDAAIAKEQEKIGKLNEVKEANGGLSEEQQNQLDAASQNVTKYGELKGAIEQNKSEQENFNMTVRDGKRDADELQEILDKPVDKKVNAETEGAKEEVSILDQLAEQEKTKKVNADTSQADGQIDNTNAKAEEGKTKDLDLNPSIANLKIIETNLKAEEKKIKPILANPLDAFNKINQVDSRAERERVKAILANPADAFTKIAEADKRAQEQKTKPIDGNPTLANAKILETNRKIEEGKIKPVDANTSGGEAKIQTMHKNAEKTATKEVKVWYSGIVEAFGGAPVYKKHNGGTTQALRPKFHGGGSPAINHQPNRAKFDEIDVRLLKNEMVLTSAQQENLFNMIRTFNAGTAMSVMKAQETATSGNSGISITNHIHEMNVRDDNDIEKIAKEMGRLERQRQRARGY
ncbi:phage tail tape measure protein [Bacillus toyonensis]|uniref:phage tail tape measure protein n=1 Tax=Bacillus toyonensis TaxID=155322 RepID=UPI000BF07448|nr:phage tail tape measure protein [Bacillus toyonensis]PEM38475.1 phage tail tape measure protein [Bacillus toyonensis]PHD64326.1 phage tail tape measure protein [Bacillus toyonensis]